MTLLLIYAGAGEGVIPPDPPPAEPAVTTGAGKKSRKGEWWKEYQEQITREAKRFDMAQAQILRQQLDHERKEKDRILREQSAIRQQNQELSEVLNNMKNQAATESATWSTLFNQANVATQPKYVDPRAEQRREQAIANLEKARAAREANKKAEEDKRKKMLKNLAKARKAKGK